MEPIITNRALAVGLSLLVITLAYIRYRMYGHIKFNHFVFALAQYGLVGIASATLLTQDIISTQSSEHIGANTVLVFLLLEIIRLLTIMSPELASHLILQKGEQDVPT